MPDDGCVRADPASWSDCCARKRRFYQVGTSAGWSVHDEPNEGWGSPQRVAVAGAGHRDGKDSIQVSISDSSQRTVFGPNLRGAGKVPSAMRRYMVELPGPVFSLTAGSA